MRVGNNNKIMCENRNTELLLNEIFRLNPDIEFYVLGDEITEHEALMLYKSVRRDFSEHNQIKKVVYVPSLKSIQVPKK